MKVKEAGAKEKMVKLKNAPQYYKGKNKGENAPLSIIRGKPLFLSTHTVIFNWISESGKYSAHSF